MKKYSGILEDNRPQKLQDKNYDTRELSMGSFKWVTKKQAIKNAKAYVKRNQFSKSSCVPSSICSALWNTEKEIFAEEPWYTSRINKPQEGCFWYDQADKAVISAYLRKDCPEVKTEALANAYNIPAGSEKKEYRQMSYLFFADPTIEEIVKFTNTGFSVPFSFFSNSKEWSQDFPKVLDTKLTIEKAPINHAVCAIPYTGYIEKGEKYFIITDSSHFGGFDTRHLSELFTDVRAKHGVVFADLEAYFKDTKPKCFNFTRDLTVGMRGDDVLALQTILQQLGFFPSKLNGVPFKPTNYFGGMTRQAVKDFQKEYEVSILWAVGLKLPTGYFGKSSIKQLKLLCS